MKPSHTSDQAPPPAVAVLCASDQLTAQMDSLDDQEGAFRSSLGVPGLAWGRGDLVAAGLLARRWAVLEAPRAEISDLDGGQVVRVHSGRIVMEGERLEAIEALIERGADPAMLAVSWRQIGPADPISDFTFAEAPAGGVALAGRHGASRAGTGGMARSGFDGVAETAAWGVSLVDEGGEAHAGEHGVAIVDGERFGAAIAADHGVAVGRGRYNTVRAGDHGAAIAHGLGRAAAGDFGLAYCRLEEARVGAGGVAVGRVVTGGPGAFLVALASPNDRSGAAYAIGVVGEGGIDADCPYRCEHGALCHVETHTVLMDHGDGDPR